MADADLLISNVSVVDGTGAPAFDADVVIGGDRITAVTARYGGTAGERLDGSGFVLAPGFVDVHTHDDVAVLTDPDHRCKTLQGVTSVVVGNCGMSATPVAEHTPGLTVFERMGNYLGAVEEAGPAVNVAALVGHGVLRAAAIGLREDRRADVAERRMMLDQLERALDDGAVGMSSGLAYEPGRYAPHSELVELNRALAGAGGIYATHMRDEGVRLLDSVAESIAVAEETGVPLQISHLKAAGRDNWGSVDAALELIDAARERGVDVMADQYPYTRGSTLLEQIVRGGALDGASPFGQMSGDELLIAAAPRNPHWEGSTVSEIAQQEGLEPREMADRIVQIEGRSCMVVIDIMSEADVRTVMKHDVVMIGSDGIPLGERPHPRLHHTYPRVLGRYVREDRVLDLAEAVRRMTSVPARRFHFVDRGVIAVGAFADLVLLDPDRVLDTGTYEDPTTVPDGIVGVWINGRRVVDSGSVTGERPGRVVRRSSL